MGIHFCFNCGADDVEDHASLMRYRATQKRVLEVFGGE
jgi:hypothetical protein